ncbi:ATP-binding protein [Bacillus taeanensis]|uniref:ATP-binding protein n=1 Tax=Bacillus taeanensis TaxID=273032 RepID=UPI001FE8C5B9|nr:ATP-binding protein [Bacillus taeanensis]
MLKGQLSFPLVLPQPSSEKGLHENSLHKFEKDFQQIYGHQQAKRALEIAAAGAHNVFMSGTPGCGKSLLAETFPSILPPLTEDAQFEVMSLYQLAGVSYPHLTVPSFRHPHPSASAVSIIGGGSTPKPGEISLSYHGVLFLDEMAEFQKKTLDMLRQPLETGKVTISRDHSTVTYSAKFMLIGAMNPCPCGHLDSQMHYCTCTAKQINFYRNRISGPILDRMDILLNLRPVNFEKEVKGTSETSEVIRDRVKATREGSMNVTRKSFVMRMYRLIGLEN